MKIKVIGAAGGEVTGSAYVVQTKNARVIYQRIVSIHGDKILVRARVHTLGGFSAHAGQTDLLNWLGAAVPSKPRVILTHGEDGPRKTLAGMIEKRFRLEPFLPRMGEVIEM